MAQPAGLLATLREPAPEEASRWHKPRKTPLGARLGALINFLVEDEHVKVVKRTGANADLVVDAGSGASFRLSFRDGVIEVRVGPSVVSGDDAPTLGPGYLDCVASFVEAIQLGTGYYVYSDDLLGFEPTGSCPGCGVENFQWQDTCDLCTTKLYPVQTGEDEFDGRSRRVVSVLLQRKMIEIATPRGRRNVEKTVAAFFEYGTAGPQVLLDIFVDMADIAEVYCDALELRKVLCRIR
jgi:hypothetical protein